MTDSMNTQQVNRCEKCKADGCTDCVDTQFQRIYGPTTGPQGEGLRIGMLNANSMLRKMDLITGMIHSHQFDIFVVVETKLNDKDVDADVTISDYKKIRFDRPEGSGGGIIIYHRECFGVEEPSRSKVETSSQDEKENTVQYIHVKVTHPWKFHVFAIYSPNKDQRKNALDYMKIACETYEGDIVMLGDLNVEPMKEIEDLGAKQIIEQPTHVTGHNSTTIDHIYTNIQIEEGSGGRRGGEKASSSRIVEYGVIRSAISDHDVIFCTVKLPDDVTLPSKSFAPDKDIKNLFDGTRSNASITECMDQIRVRTKNMGPIHKSYSTTATPSDIMAEGIREIERRKIEAMKSRTYELKWRDISQAKEPYQPKEKYQPEHQPTKQTTNQLKMDNERPINSLIKDFAECSEFLTSSSILSGSRNPDEVVTQREIKTAIEWVIRYRANKVGRFHKVEELVKEWTSGPVLDALIEGYKSFFVASKPTSTSESDTENDISEPTSTSDSDTEPTMEGESSAESIIYGVFDYLIASRMKVVVDIVKSRAETLKELHKFLEESVDKECILGYFYKCSATNFESILCPFDKTTFDDYWSERERRGEIKESALFRRYLAVKTAELKSSAEFKALNDCDSQCEMFASADEIAFCITFDGGIKKERDDAMEKKLELMDKLNTKVLDVYDKNTVSILTASKTTTISKPSTTNTSTTIGPSVGNILITIKTSKSITTHTTTTTSVDFPESNINIKAITDICHPAERNILVTFLGVKIHPNGIASTKNKETLQKLERLESVNKSFASQESSIIESVRLFTKD